MPKEILVITGSPRRKGNSDQLADAFINGARAAGHITYKFEAAYKNVQGCRGCDMCWASAIKPCVVKDDFFELIPLIEKCGVLVLASPVYFWGFSSQIKAVIDRFYPYCKSEGKKRIAVKESVLLLSLGDTEDATYSHAALSYKDIADFMEWKDRGIIAAKGVNKKTDILKSEALVHAGELGRTI
jgi:multimeric flavodoxin WrbA